MIRKLNDDGQESILQEAHRLTHGDRNATYAHPYDDYTCTAALFTALLGDQLKSPITAHQMALAMCCVKLSRESRVPKRDNLVDLAGYAWVARMCHEEHTARTEPEVSPIKLWDQPDPPKGQHPSREPPRMCAVCIGETAHEPGCYNAPVGAASDGAYASSRADELAPRAQKPQG